MEQNNMEQQNDLQRTFEEQHPLFRLMMQSINMIPQQGMSDNILQRTFEEQQRKETPCCNKFIEELEEMEITQEDVDNKLSCSICLDEFKLGERVHELPCEPSKHYFHIKNENCEGVIPWLSMNNTCPMCRYEFPTPPIPQEEEIVESQEEIEIQGQQELPPGSIPQTLPPGSIPQTLPPGSIPQGLPSIPQGLPSIPQGLPSIPQGLPSILQALPPGLIPTNNTTLTPEQVEGLRQNPPQNPPQNLNNILRTVLLRRNLQQMSNGMANEIANGMANEIANGMANAIANEMANDTIDDSIMPEMDIIREGFSDRDIDEALRRSLEN